MHEELVDRADEAEERMEDPDGWCVAKTVGLMLLGTAMAAAFADPLVDAVQNISKATLIPPFLVSFVVLPLATNSIGEPVSSVKCISDKRQRTASLTFSEVRSTSISKSFVKRQATHVISEF
jgi:Ca2+/H+ antiporter